MRGGRRLVAGGVVLVAVVLTAAVGGGAVRRSAGLLGGPPGGDPPGQVGVAWESGLLSPGGDRLAVRFPGPAAGADEPCGADYVGLVGATLQGLRVTVITIPGRVGATERARADGVASACPGGAPTPRCTEVRLPFPPAERPIYDGVGGGARPVSTARSATALCDQLLAG